MGCNRLWLLIPVYDFLFIFIFCLLHMVKMIKKTIDRRTIHFYIFFLKMKTTQYCQNETGITRPGFALVFNIHVMVIFIIKVHMLEKKISTKIFKQFHFWQAVFLKQIFKTNLLISLQTLKMNTKNNLESTFGIIDLRQLQRTIFTFVLHTPFVIPSIHYSTHKRHALAHNSD